MTKGLLVSFSMYKTRQGSTLKTNNNNRALYEFKNYLMVILEGVGLAVKGTRI